MHKYAVSLVLVSSVWLRETAVSRGCMITRSGFELFNYVLYGHRSVPCELSEPRTSITNQPFFIVLVRCYQFREFDAMGIKMFGRVAVLLCVSNLLFFTGTATGKLDSVARSCMCV